MTDPNYIKQVSLAGSPAEENSASWGQLAVSLVIGGASAVVWLAIVQDRRPAALLAAFAFGATLGLGAWLIADALDDQRRRGRVSTELKERQSQGWPAEAAAQCRSDGISYQSAANDWAADLERRLWIRYAGGALAAVCGAVATFLFLTPERVLQHDILTLGLASLLGLVISLVGAVATWKRTEAWEALFAQWVRQAGEWKSESPPPPLREPKFKPPEDEGGERIPQTPDKEPKLPETTGWPWSPPDRRNDNDGR